MRRLIANEEIELASVDQLWWGLELVQLTKVVLDYVTVMQVLLDGLMEVLTDGLMEVVAGGLMGY